MLALLDRNRKVLGFITFGALAGGVYAAVLLLTVEKFRMPLFFGSVLAFAVAIPVSYFGNRWVTYRSRNVLAPEAFRFVVVQVTNLLITSAIVHYASERFALSTYVGVVIAFVAAPIVSFVLYELWVYRQRHNCEATKP